MPFVTGILLIRVLVALCIRCFPDIIAVQPHTSTYLHIRIANDVSLVAAAVDVTDSTERKNTIILGLSTYFYSFYVVGRILMSIDVFINIST